MAERGVWAGIGWRSVGVGVGPGYAVVWFADAADTSARDMRVAETRVDETPRPSLTYASFLDAPGEAHALSHDAVAQTDSK